MYVNNSKAGKKQFFDLKILLIKIRILTILLWSSTEIIKYVKGKEEKALSIY